MITLIATWIMFNKAKLHGWAAIIPFYNLYTLFQMVYSKGWKFLLLLIPFYNIYVAIKFEFDLAKVFGKGVGFGWGLFLLNPIFMWILGFGKAEYVGPRA